MTVTIHDRHQGWPLDLRTEGSTDLPVAMTGNIQIGEVTEHTTEGVREMGRAKTVDTDEIVRLLTDEGPEPIRVQERLGISHTTFERHVNKALEAGTIERAERGVYRRVGVGEQMRQDTYQLAAVEEMTDATSFREAFRLIAELAGRLEKLERSTKDMVSAHSLGTDNRFGAVHGKLDQLTRRVESQVLGSESEVQKRLDGYAQQIHVIGSRIGDIDKHVADIEMRVTALEMLPAYEAQEDEERRLVTDLLKMASADRSRLVEILDRVLGGAA